MARDRMEWRGVKELIMPELSALAASLGALLKERGETVAVCESASGGLISAALVSIGGASAYYLGGAVSYTQSSREGIMEVSAEMMEGMRASTEPYAEMNARIIRDKLGATWGLGETGASGPTGNRYGDAAGHACIAVVGPVERSITLETGSADREANMWVFAKTALELLENCIKEQS
jgi:nicotinamide-nucleotide amidase